METLLKNISLQHTLKLNSLGPSLVPDSNSHFMGDCMYCYAAFKKIINDFPLYFSVINLV